MNRKTTIALALALGAMLLWFVANGGGRDEPKSGTGAPDARSELTDEPAKAAAPEKREPEPSPQAQPEERREPATRTREPVDPRAKAGAPVPMGPIEELARLFRTEPRGPAAVPMERHIAAAFRIDGTPPELLQSVLCRTTVCRIETRWTAERAEPFLGAFMGLMAGRDGTQSELFDPDLAVSPEDEIDENGVLAVTVYLRLREPALRAR